MLERKKLKFRSFRVFVRCRRTYVLNNTFINFIVHNTYNMYNYLHNLHSSKSTFYIDSIHGHCILISVLPGFQLFHTLGFFLIVPSPEQGTSQTILSYFTSSPAPSLYKQNLHFKSLLVFM